MALLSNVSKEPVELIAVDTGAGEHFVKPGHAQLLSGLQRSGVSAIGVSGAPIKASNQGQLLVKLLDKRSGKVFTMDLGLGHTLPDLPVSLLSVSKLVPTGSSFYFSKEESWMKLPNGGAKIMLERRDGLFFLPVYRTDAKAAPGLVSQSTVTVASLASGSVERDTSGNDVVEEEHVQAQPDSFWQQFVDKVPKQVVTNSKPLRNSDFRKRAAEVFHTSVWLLSSAGINGYDM